MLDLDLLRKPLAEGIKVLDNKILYRTLDQFNMRIPKYQYIDNI